MEAAEAEAVKIDLDLMPEVYKKVYGLRIFRILREICQNDPALWNKIHQRALEIREAERREAIPEK